jgi:tetratricopeptide (TPR) repeat protein
MRANDIARLTCISLLCTGVLTSTASCGRGSGKSADTPDQAARARKVVLVGLDAGDWLAIDPMIGAGRLPAFARLRTLGRTGVMAATPPLISPMLWTTIATGVEPENHGVLDFMADLPDGRQVPVGSSQRLAPALWNLFSNAGRRVGVVGWWATWPAERVNGTMVSDALAPQLTRASSRDMPALTSPADALNHVADRVVDVSALTRADLAGYVALSDAEFRDVRAAYAQPGTRFYSNPLAHLGSIIAGTRTYSGVAEELLRSHQPDFLAVYFEAVDTVSHLFVRDPVRGPHAIERAYLDADTLLRRLADASAPDTLFVVCSDHGFYPATSGIAEDPANLAGPATAWHRPYGIVAVAMARSLASSTAAAELSAPADIGSVAPVDIAPTILHAAGLRVPVDMPGRVVTSMLPADAAAVPTERAPPTRYTPPAIPEGGPQDDAALQRLRALGYVGAARTSLARQNLGESLFRRGHLAAAERELRAVTEAQPGNVSASLWLAQTLVRQGRARDALAVYERVMLLPGGARDALVPAVDLALATGDLSMAERVSVSANAPPAVALVARGALAQARRDPRGAERAYRAALDADPLSFDAAARLLDLLSASGRARDARRVVERAAELAPDSPRHLALLGQLRLQMRDGPAAEAALTRALELAPDGRTVRAALARALLVQHKASRAVEVLLPMPASQERDVLLGSAYSAQAKWKEAAAHLQGALDAGAATPDVTVLNALGWALLQLGRRDEAAQLFVRSLAVEGQQPEIRRLLTDVQSARRGPAR